MADMGLSTTSTEVLEHECTTLAARIASATCRWLLVIAELDRRGTWGCWWGCKSMAHWLSWRCALSEVTAREYVRVAHALMRLPLTAELFGRGELSCSKVRTLTRIATPANEHDLVDLARTATAAQLDRIVRASAVAASDPATREAMRELVQGVDADGFGTTRVRLPLDAHCLVEEAIAKAVDDAPAEAPIAARRADALVRICESYLATGDAARPGADRHAVVIHLDANAAGGIVAAETDRGDPVHPETARRMACDATLQAILHGEFAPVGAGRATRTPNRALRRAMHRRNRGRCEWNGCDERTYVELHHIQHWSNGGPTEWWNLAALCWRHHRLVHEGGFRIDLDRATGTITCFTPSGTVLDHATPATGSEPLDAEVDAETIVPLWAGEAFDLSACVDAVLAAGTQTRGSPWRSARPARPAVDDASAGAHRRH